MKKHYTLFTPISLHNVGTVSAGGPKELRLKIEDACCEHFGIDCFTHHVNINHVVGVLERDPFATFLIETVEDRDPGTKLIGISETKIY